MTAKMVGANNSNVKKDMTMAMRQTMTAQCVRAAFGIFTTDGPSTTTLPTCIVPFCILIGRTVAVLLETIRKRKKNNINLVSDAVNLPAGCRLRETLYSSSFNRLHSSIEFLAMIRMHSNAYIRDSDSTYMMCP